MQKNFKFPKLKKFTVKEIWNSPEIRLSRGVFKNESSICITIMMVHIATNASFLENFPWKILSFFIFKWLIFPKISWKFRRTFLFTYTTFQLYNFQLKFVKWLIFYCYYWPKYTKLSDWIFFVEIFLKLRFISNNIFLNYIYI